MTYKTYEERLQMVEERVDALTAVVRGQSREEVPRVEVRNSGYRGSPHAVCIGDVVILTHQDEDYARHVVSNLNAALTRHWPPAPRESEPRPTADHGWYTEEEIAKRIADAVAKEREACAKVAESWQFDPNAPKAWARPMAMTANAIAFDIRSRAQPPAPEGAAPKQGAVWSFWPAPTAPEAKGEELRAKLAEAEEERDFFDAERIKVVEALTTAEAERDALRGELAMFRSSCACEACVHARTAGGEKTSGNTPAEGDDHEQGIRRAHAERDREEQGGGDRTSVRRVPGAADAGVPGGARAGDHEDEAGGSVLLREEGDGERAEQHAVGRSCAKCGGEEWLIFPDRRTETRGVPCPDCNAQPPAPEGKCEKCGGKGTVTVESWSANSTPQFPGSHTVRCPACAPQPEAREQEPGVTLVASDAENDKPIGAKPKSAGPTSVDLERAAREICVRHYYKPSARAHYREWVEKGDGAALLVDVDVQGDCVELHRHMLDVLAPLLTRVREEARRDAYRDVLSDVERRRDGYVAQQAEHIYAWAINALTSLAVDLRSALKAKAGRDG